MPEAIENLKNHPPLAMKWDVARFVLAIVSGVTGVCLIGGGARTLFPVEILLPLACSLIYPTRKPLLGKPQWTPTTWKFVWRLWGLGLVAQIYIAALLFMVSRPAYQPIVSRHRLALAMPCFIFAIIVVVMVIGLAQSRWKEPQALS